MKIKKLTENQTKVLNKLWTVLGLKDTNFDNLLNSTISEFQEKYGIKYTKTDMAKHLKKAFILNVKKDKLDLAIAKYNLSRASFNSIEVVKDLHTYYLKQLLTEFKNCSKKLSELNGKLSNEKKLTNAKVMEILSTNYSKYLVQSKNTKAKKDALYAVDCLNDKIADIIISIENISKSKNHEFDSIKYLDKASLKTSLFYMQDELKKSKNIKKQVKDFLAANVNLFENVNFTFKFTLNDNKYNTLHKENIRMIPRYELDFKSQSNMVKHLTKDKEFINRFNSYKDEYYEFKNLDPIFLNMYNEHYAYMKQKNESIENIINENKSIISNSSYTDVSYSDTCNDYDHPDSYYLSVSRKLNSCLYESNITHEYESIGRSYEIKHSEEITILPSLLTQTGKELFKKYTKDSTLKMGKDIVLLSNKMQKMYKTLETFKQYNLAPKY